MRSHFLNFEWGQMTNMVVFGKTMYCPVCFRKFKATEHWGGLPTVIHDKDSLATTDCPNAGQVFVFPSTQVSST